MSWYKRKKGHLEEEERELLLKPSFLQPKSYLLSVPLRRDRITDYYSAAFQ